MSVTRVRRHIYVPSKGDAADGVEGRGSHCKVGASCLGRVYFSAGELGGTNVLAGGRGRTGREFLLDERSTDSSCSSKVANKAPFVVLLGLYFNKSYTAAERIFAGGDLVRSRSMSLLHPIREGGRWTSSLKQHLVERRRMAETKGKVVKLGMRGGRCEIEMVNSCESPLVRRLWGGNMQAGVKQVPS